MRMMRNANGRKLKMLNRRDNGEDGKNREHTKVGLPVLILYNDD